MKFKTFLPSLLIAGGLVLASFSQAALVGDEVRIFNSISANTGVATAANTYAGASIDRTNFRSAIAAFHLGQSYGVVTGITLVGTVEKLVGSTWSTLTVNSVAMVTTVSVVTTTGRIDYLSVNLRQAPKYIRLKIVSTVDGAAPVTVAGSIVLGESRFTPWK